MLIARKTIACRLGAVVRKKPCGRRQCSGRTEILPAIVCMFRPRPSGGRAGPELCQKGKKACAWLDRVEKLFKGDSWESIHENCTDADEMGS